MFVFPLRAIALGSSLGSESLDKFASSLVVVSGDVQACLFLGLGDIRGCLFSEYSRNYLDIAY